MTDTSPLRNASLIDTSYLLALELSNDSNHPLAQSHWKQVVHSLPVLVLTSYIFDEVVTFLNSRGRHAKAVQLGQMLLESPTIHFTHVDEATFHEGWDLFRIHRDKDYSLTDCLSFVVMRRMEIYTAYTFDHHFLQAGFLVEPIRTA
jgi:uncharacterized protein